MSWDEGVVLFHCIDVFVPDVFVPVSAPRPGPYPNRKGPNREGPNREGIG